MLQRITRRFPGGAQTEPQTKHDIKMHLLAEAELFRDLTPADMEEIERLTTMITCKRGRVFYSSGETGEVLFILKKGRVQLHRISEDGRKLVTGIVGAGAVFGEMPLLSQRMYDSVAEALEDCTLCVMSRSDVEQLVKTKPNVALNIIQLLGDRIRELERMLEMQAFQAVPTRLAVALLSLAGDGTEIQGMSHQLLAETIGAARETVTRVLGDFYAAGLIEMGRSHITITNPDGLRMLTRE